MKVYRFEHRFIPDSTPNHIELLSVPDDIDESMIVDALELSAQISSAHGGESHLSVDIEFPQFESGLHICGCASLEKLFKWFDGFIDDLFYLRFVVKVFEVPERDVIQGDMQCIFDPSRAVLVDTIHRRPEAV